MTKNYKKIIDIIELDLVKDDVIEEQLTNIIKKHKIKNAFFNGIGAGKNLKVGYLINHNPIKYKEINCNSPYEITSFIGNVKNGKSHTHITLSNNISNVIGGHFISGKVAFIFQLYIQVLEYDK